MIRPEDLEIIYFGEETNHTDTTKHVIEKTNQLKYVSDSIPENITLPDIHVIATPSKSKDYTDEWKAIDAKAGNLYHDRAKISNSLINLSSNEQRAIAYKQIVSMTEQYNDLQIQKNALERGETIELVKEAKEIDYSGYTGLQLHKEIENLRSKLSKRKKSLENKDTSPKYRQKYEREIKEYITNIEKLTKLKNA